MSIQLGSAYGKVSIDSSGVKSGVGSAITSLENLGRVGTMVGDAMKQAGQAMTVGLTLPILAMGAASIQAASSYNETKNRAVVVFKEMSDSIVANSEKASTALGMNKKQYLDYAANIGAALTAGGMSIKESTALAEQAVKHFADIGSFYEAKTEDVALAWQSAIRGQYEPIQKYFPFINDAYLKTYGAANGIVDANTKNLTANQRAIILNAIALDEKLNPALNDFAETSGSLANQGKSLQAQFGDALIALGSNLLPIALKVVTALNKMLAAFNSAPPFVQKAILAFIMFLAVLGPILTVVGTVISTISSLVTVAGGLGISFTAASAAIGTAGTVLVAIGGAALSALGSILLLATGPVLLYLAFKNNFMGITTTVKQLWEIIKYYFRQIMTYISNSFRSINWREIGVNMLRGLANGILLGIPAIIAAAAKAGQAALQAMRKALDSHSPSREFMKIGVDSGDGYKMGLLNSVNPTSIAKMMAKPVQQMTNQQSTRYQINMASGLTLQDVEALMTQKIDRFSARLERSLRGA